MAFHRVTLLPQKLRRGDLEVAARYFTDAFTAFLKDSNGNERPEKSEVERFYARVAYLNATWCQFMKSFVAWKKVRIVLRCLNSCCISRYL